MSSCESSDDEDHKFKYWNDWKPPHLQEALLSNNVKENLFANNTNTENIYSLKYSNNFGNWIPPQHFNREPEFAGRNRVKRKKSVKEIWKDNFKKEITMNSTTNELQPCSFTQINENLIWEKVLNRDWGERIELHDVSHFANGDFMWGVVSLGSFDHIKLWMNEYGNICGSAEGKISKEGSSESSLISITDINLLKKMLNLTNAQWSSLSEIVLKNKLSLKFDALNDNNIMNMNSFEKLWFYICKRRHFLPDQCMLVKFQGAIKSLKEFKIIPKLIVCEIRDINGKS